MAEKHNNTLPTNNVPEQPSFWGKFWILGFIPVGAFLSLLGFALCDQLTFRPSDDWLDLSASVTILTGMVTFAVASLLSFAKLLRILWRTRHRWFRFSLRTMLVVMTLVCVICGYLAWAMNWKRERHQILARLSSRYEPGSNEQRYAAAGWVEPSVGTGLKPTTAPFPLWFLGEEGFEVVSVWHISLEDYQRIELLFPEAHLFGNVKKDGLNTWMVRDVD